MLVRAAANSGLSEDPWPPEFSPAAYSQASAPATQEALVRSAHQPEAIAGGPTGPVPLECAQVISIKEKPLAGCGEEGRVP